MVPFANSGRFRQGAGAQRAPDRLKKSLGQHLLVSPGVLDDIVRSAQIGPNDLVVEVGPGTGLLTTRLAEAAGRVVAVEIDEAMAARTREATRQWNSVAIVEGDVLAQDPRALAGGQPYLVVANLPYNVAVAIVRMFLESELQPTRLVVTVQREVAQEMCAEPGHLGLLGLSVQLYAEPRIVRRVAPGSFRPPPKVESAVVRMDVRPEPAVPREALPDLFRIARAGFGNPRKQLRNSLSTGLGIPPQDVEHWFSACGADPRRRAQSLSIAEWGGLVEHAPTRPALR